MMNFLDILRHFIETEDGKILFVLAAISVAMIIDFITGTIAAYVNPQIEFVSKAGINGILRKLASMLLLLIFIPVSVLIPNGAGVGLVYTLYLGYLAMEIKSIVENVGKNGTDTSLFQHIVKKLAGDGTDE